MLTPKSQFAYFENLEETIKIGFALYLLFFVGGCISILLGGEILNDFLHHGRFVEIGGGVIACGAAFWGIYWSTSRIQWLGEIHIWLDKILFGFLKKSNTIIFDGLIVALPQEERETAVNIGTGEQGLLAQSIFSQLAKDNQLFATLLQSGIFRYWIWYWIMIYGTFLSSSLTAGSFFNILLGSDPGGKTLFSIFWILALLHLAVTLLLGFFLLRMTKQTVNSMVLSHQNEIASILRANIKRFQMTL